MYAAFKYQLTDESIDFYRVLNKVANTPAQIVEVTLPKHARAVIFAQKRFHDLGEFASEGEALIALAFVRKHVSDQCPQFPPNRFLDPDDYEQPTMQFDYRSEIPRGVFGRLHPHGDYAGAVIDHQGCVLHICDMAPGAEWTTEEMHLIEFNAHVLADDLEDASEPDAADLRKKARNELDAASWKLDSHLVSLAKWSNACSKAACDAPPPDWLSAVGKDATWWDLCKEKYQQCTDAYDAASAVTRELKTELQAARKRALEQ